MQGLRDVGRTGVTYFVSQVVGVHAHQKEDRQADVGEEELESSGPAYEVVAIVVVVGRGRRWRGEERGDLHDGRWRRGRLGKVDEAL